jgi:hypothetical protein
MEGSTNRVDGGRSWPSMAVALEIAFLPTVLPIDPMAIWLMVVLRLSGRAQPS